MHRNAQESGGMEQNSTGMDRNPAEWTGIWRNGQVAVLFTPPLILTGIRWNGQESTRMDRNPLEWTGICRNGQESTGMDRNLQEWTGIHWNGQESREIHRNC